MFREDSYMFKSNNKIYVLGWLLIPIFTSCWTVLSKLRSTGWLPPQIHIGNYFLSFYLSKRDSQSKLQSTGWLPHQIHIGSYFVSFYLSITEIVINKPSTDQLPPQIHIGNYFLSFLSIYQRDSQLKVIYRLATSSDTLR